MIAEVAGFTGAGISGGAYIPQIGHLIRAHCSAGISETAYAWWLVASALILVQAVTIHAAVFIVLSILQISAMIVIMAFTAKYKDEACALHASAERKEMP